MRRIRLSRSRIPSPQSSTPQLFEIASRSLMPASWIARMSTLGMPQSPKPPTDRVIPSVMPSMAAAGLETTLSMARDSSHPRGSPLRSDTRRTRLAAAAGRPARARHHAYPVCLWLGHIREFGLEQRCVRPWGAMPKGDDVRAVDDRPAGYVVDTRSPFRRRSSRRGPLPPLKPSGKPAGKPSGGPPPRSPGRAPVATAPPRPRRTGRNVLIAVLVIVILWVAFLVWVPVNAWNSVTRVDTNPSGDRPAAADGYNYLLVGSRQPRGAHRRRSARRSTAAATAERQAHRLDHPRARPRQRSARPRWSRSPGTPTSRSPDTAGTRSTRPIAIGGAKLLAQTVEQVTGVHVDGYVEIGFGGFAGVVDSLGGVDVCVTAT